MATDTNTLTTEDCLDHRGDGSCRGRVEYRMALSASGKSFPRCERHWGERLDREDEITARYPYHEPADFDPMCAGERWDDAY